MVDVPKDAGMIGIGVVYAGAAWIDVSDIAVEVVGDEVPVTDMLQGHGLRTQPANLAFDE